MHGVTTKEFSAASKYRPTSSFVESLYNDSGIVTSGSSNIIFKTSNYNERMRLSASGDVSIGTSSSFARLSVVGGNLLNSTLAFDAHALTGSGLVVTNFNRVGVGTSSPSSKFHVYSSNAGVADTAITIEAGNGKRYVIMSGINGVSNYGLQFYDSTDNKSRMVIDNNGFVGIGDSSTSPSYKLDIKGTSTIDSSLRLWFTSSNTAGNYNSIIMPVYNGTSGFELRHYGNSTDGYATYFMGGQSNSSLYFSGGTISTSSRHLTVHNSGFVGVNTGTSYPSGQLHVNASSSATIGTVIRAASSQTADLTQWQNSSAVTIAKVNSGGSAFFQNLTSSVWISGSSAVFSNITASSLTTGSILFVGNAGAISQSNDSLYWNYSTNMLGIRTASPTHILHISPVLTSQTTGIYGLLTDHDITQTGDVSTVAAGAFTLRQKGSVNQTNSGNGSSAMIASAFCSNTATVTAMSAIRADTRNLSTGTITSAVGVLVNDIANSGGGTITSAYGMRIQPQTGGTSIYGVYSEISNSINNYNFYAAGSAKNRFEGPLWPNRNVQSSSISNVITDYALRFKSADTNTFIPSIGWCESQTESGTINAAMGGYDDGASGAQGLWWATGNNSTLTERLRITSAGLVGIGTTSPGAQLQVNASSSSTIGSIIKGAASQTVNLTEWQNSSGTVLTAIDAAGRIKLDTSMTYPGGVTSDGYVYYNSADGIVMYGAGSTSDWSTLNKSGNVVLSTPTGTTNVGITNVAALAKLDIRYGAGTTEANIKANIANNIIAISSNYTAGADYAPGIVFYSADNNATKAKAGIYSRYTSVGSWLLFGTSNTYSTGITNNAMLIDPSGNVGIGVTSPSASLHLKSGTSTTGGSPLKFTSGSLLSTPESGSLEYNGNTFYMSNKNNVGGRSSIVGCIYTHTSSITIVDTVDETSILQSPVVLPVNFFSVGKNLSIKMFGFHSSVSAPSVQLKVLFNSSSCLDTGMVATLNSVDGYYELNGEICCRTVGVSGSLYATGFYREKNNTGGSSEYYIVNTTSSSINTTVTQSLNITFTWNAADANNTCTTTNGYIIVQN
jgi:hypothetical protein